MTSGEDISRGFDGSEDRSGGGGWLVVVVVVVVVVKA
jgi:hypothetical protein